MPRIKKQHLKKRKDGRYACRYKNEWFYGETEQDALLQRERFKARERAGRAARYMRLTVNEYVNNWLPAHKAGVKPSTYNQYCSVLEHVAQPIADDLLDEITPDDIAVCYAGIKNRSESYIHKAKILLQELFDSAVDAGHIDRNPARAASVKPPRGESGTHRAITKAERELIEYTPHRCQLAALIMLYAGLRRGEVLALSARDIGEYITVRRAVSYTSNQPIISKPKTEAGERRVPVFGNLAPYLKNVHGLILPKMDGGIMTEQAFSCAWSSYMKALSRAAGHPVNIRPHDLRHTFCTLLRDAGVDIHQAIIWMGHADEKMILRIYDHPGNEREEAAKKQLEALFGSQNGSQNQSAAAKTVDT